MTAVRGHDEQRAGHSALAASFASLRSAEHTILQGYGVHDGAKSEPPRLMLFVGFSLPVTFLMTMLMDERGVSAAGPKGHRREVPG